MRQRFSQQPVDNLVATPSSHSVVMEQPQSLYRANN